MMADRGGDSPHDIVSGVERLARRAAAGQVDRSAFLADVTSALVHLLDASPETLDDTGPYLLPGLDVVQAALGHVLDHDVPLDAAGYRAISLSISTAVRRAHLRQSVDEVAAQLRRAGLLPPDWKPRPHLAQSTIPPSVLAGQYLDEDDGGEPSPPLVPRPSVSRRVRPPRSQPAAPWWAPLQLLGLGWVVVVSLVGGVIAGLWLDQQLGTAPFALLIGLALGVSVAYVSVRSMLRRVSR
jgi:hypothetical protein